VNGRFRHHGDTTVHTGRIWDLVVGHFESPDGELFDREIVRSPGAVGVVALVGDEGEGEPRVVLVAQYRPPYDGEVIEIPAGVRDVPGEPVEVTARRELIEEAGLDPATIEPLMAIYPSPGLTDSVTTIVLARDCTSVPQDLQGPEERHMRVFEVPLGEAAAMVDRGEITDAKSVAGILLAERRWHRLAG
jgi:8-oxo-dGTP pyrophosphatase MutT (NUDIX family)